MSMRQIRVLEGLWPWQGDGGGVGWGSRGVTLNSGLSHMRMIAGDSKAGLGTGGQTAAYPLPLLSGGDSSDSPLALLLSLPRACCAPGQHGLLVD